MRPSRFTRRRIPILAAIALAVSALVAQRLIASDHNDGPAVLADHAADAADAYVFRSPSNPNNVVFVLTVAGFIPPTEATTTSFDPALLYQFKIDTNGDAVEDKVIQAWATGLGASQTMSVRGPERPAVTGSVNFILPGKPDQTVPVDHAQNVVADQSKSSIKVWAGVADDPFFLDVPAARGVLVHDPAWPSTRDPGIDTFAGTNVLAIVVEVPAAQLGVNPRTGKFAVWGTVSRQQ